MDANLQRRIQRYGWDKAADFYEMYWQRQLEPAQTRLLDIVHLRNGERVLDVACGSGLVTFRAAAMVGTNGSVLGTDISEKMVDIARKRIPDSHQMQVQFSRADAEDLSLDEGTFDVAICSLGLMYVPDPRNALAQMHRVLKSRGRATLAVWGQRSRCGWAEIFPIVDARVQSDVCPMFFQLGGSDVLKNLCQEVGFTKVDAERLDVQLEYDSPEDACGAAFAGGPVALAYSKFSDTVKEEVHAEYLASIAAFRRGAGYSIPGEFVIAYGEKV